MNAQTLTAGVARVDITPPIGFRLQGAMRRIEPSTGVESPLLARALVLADEQTKVVILDCDLIGVDPALGDKIRKTIGDRLGIPSTRVIAGFTHTHNGPCTTRGTIGGPHHGGGKPGEIEILEAYIETLVHQLTGLAVAADGRRKPARAAAGRGEAPGGVHREELLPDGRIVVGRNPSGPHDHSVDVLRIDDLQGKPIAVMTGYAAHPVVMGYQTHLLSPDFPGVVRRIVEQATGATCIYLTGAAGNQALMSFLQSDWGEMERIGGVIGAEALKVFYGIETRPHEEIRELGVSLSNIALYHKEFRDGPTHQRFQAAARKVTIPFHPMPPIEKAEADLAKATANLEKLEAQNEPTTRTYPARLVKVWAQTVVDKIKAGVKQDSRQFDIVGFRLDDFALVGMPGEPFVEIGLAVKKRSKAKHTQFAGYCNSVIAYWPTPDIVGQGTAMSVDAALKSYNIPTPPVPETVEILVSGFDALLKEMDL